MSHEFVGGWISNGELAALEPRNVFFRQLAGVKLDCSEHRDRHVLFRRHFVLGRMPTEAKIYITADDYYKLYVNGRFVAQGPAPSYHFRYCYNEIDLSAYLVEGENVIAVHTLYQGLINRVWQSGDQRHGLICDLEVDGAVILSSDEDFLVRVHTGYTEMSTGENHHNTQFMERYDSRCAEVGFEDVDFDDRDWEKATLCRHDDHTLRPQDTHMLVFEEVAPKTVTRNGNSTVLDFGAIYVGYFSARGIGQNGEVVRVRCAQELNDDGTLRYQLRAACTYDEEWILSGGEDELEWYDYKAFRYVELIASEGASLSDFRLTARHYPFTLRAAMAPEYATDERLRSVWELCVRSQRYGVQEAIQDCMDREKGFYLGDGCYSALTNMILTRDDTMVRKLIDDAFSTSFITDTLMTCMDCSFMQEIAEYPLITVFLILWHYRLTGDRTYLSANYQKATALMEAYRREYERDGLLRNLDKWCVVEWPQNFRHDYDADLTQGKICEKAHVSINAYYLYAVKMMNEMARVLGEEPYRDLTFLYDAFLRAFYDERSKTFVDSEGSTHVSPVGNSFVYGFGLYPNEESRREIVALLDRTGVDALSFYCTFPVLMEFVRDGEDERLRQALAHEGTWSRMLREGATTTFEGWGKASKRNASLFHLTFTYAAAFLSDIDRKALFACDG